MGAGAEAPARWELKHQDGGVVLEKVYGSSSNSFMVLGHGPEKAFCEKLRVRWVCLSCGGGGGCDWIGGWTKPDSTLAQDLVIFRADCGQRLGGSQARREECAWGPLVHFLNK